MQFGSWRDDLDVKSSGSPFRGPRFDSQCPNVLQLCNYNLTVSEVIFWSLWATYTIAAQTNLQAKYVNKAQEV